MASISMLRASANGEISSLTEEAYLGYQRAQDAFYDLSLTESFQKADYMILEEGYNVLEESYHMVLNEGAIGSIFRAITSFFSKIIEVLKSLLNKIKQFFRDLFSGGGSSSSSSSSSNSSSSSSSKSSNSSSGSSSSSGAIHFKCAMWDFTSIGAMITNLLNLADTALNGKIDSYCPAISDLTSLEQLIEKALSNISNEELTYDTIGERCKGVFSSITDKKIPTDVISANIYRDVSSALGISVVTDAHGLKRAIHSKICSEEPRMRDITPLIEERKIFMDTAESYIKDLSKTVEGEISTCEKIKHKIEDHILTESDISDMVDDIIAGIGELPNGGNSSGARDTFTKIIKGLISNISNSITTTMTALVACLNNVETCLMTEIRNAIDDSKRIMHIWKKENE